MANNMVFDLAIVAMATAPRTGAGSFDWTTSSGQHWVCLGGSEDLETEAVTGKATWDNYGDVTSSGHELAAATGYSTGGLPLLIITAATGGTNVCKFDATDTAWGSTVSFTAYNAITKGGNALTTSTAPLISLHDFAGAQQVSSGTLTLQWATNGCFTITVATAA